MSSDFEIEFNGVHFNARKYMQDKEKERKRAIESMIPDGKYDAEITKLESSVRNHSIKLKFQIISGEYKDKYVCHTIVTNSADREVSEYAKDFVAQLAEALDRLDAYTYDDFLDRPLIITVNYNEKTQHREVVRCEKKIENLSEYMVKLEERFIRESEPIVVPNNFYNARLINTKMKRDEHTGIKYYNIEFEITDSPYNGKRVGSKICGDTKRFSNLFWPTVWAIRGNIDDLPDNCEELILSCKCEELYGGECRICVKNQQYNGKDYPQVVEVMRKDTSSN